MFSAFETSGALAEVLKNAYPFSPTALYVLPRLAARLAQNERTIFSFVRDVAFRKIPSFGDLYQYFSPSMASDTGAGGSHRRWLETESALSKANSDLEREILSSVAVLGFGISGERTRTRKELVEFAVAGFSGHSASSIKEAVADLIDRKLLLYRSRSDDVSVWHGTDVDIRSRLNEEILRVRSEFGIVEILEKEHPPPNWRPVVHNVKNSIRRFFEGKYVPASELLQKKQAHPLLKLEPGEDGRVIYCIPSTQKEIDALNLFLQSFSADPAVVFVVPDRTDAMLDVVFEIVALGRLGQDIDFISTDPFVIPELDHMMNCSREDLGRVVTRILSPEEQCKNWFSEGKKFLLKNTAELCERLSEIADRRFSHSPLINNELVIRKQISRPMKNARKKLILGILERSGEPHLGFDRQATTPDVSMYRTVLERTRLYGSFDGKWSWAVGSERIQDSNVGEVWKILDDFFSEPGNGKSPREEIFNRLENPPYGIRKGVLPVLVASAMQAFGRGLVVRRDGKYLSDVLASEVEEFCSEPERFTVDVIEVDEKLSGYMRVLIEQFGEFQDGYGDLLRQFHDALKSWKESLPPQALRTSFLSQEAQGFQSVVRSDEDPASIALRRFPALVGERGPNDRVLSAISRFMREMESVSEGYTQKAVFMASKVFDSGFKEHSSLLERARDWSRCFDEKMVALSDISNMSKAVFSRSLEATEERYTEASFVRALSFVLLGKGFDKWDDSTPKDFTNRLSSSVAEMERMFLDAAGSDKSALPILRHSLQRLYARLESVLGYEEAEEEINTFLSEKAEQNISMNGGVKASGTC